MPALQQIPSYTQGHVRVGPTITIPRRGVTRMRRVRPQPLTIQRFIRQFIPF